MKKQSFSSLVLLGTPFLCGCLAAGVPIEEIKNPIVFVGDEIANTNADGGLRWAVGAKNIQVYRANRTATEHLDGINHTYFHAPNLAYWNGRFYLAHLHGAVNEHDTPTDTSFHTSKDGLNWEQPRLLFPAYELPDGTMTLMHQRMTWYTAPDGRLLATGFHGKAPSPNDGHGVGRVVREVFRDGSLGPIYFLRYNQLEGWNPADAAEYPFFTESSDTGFVAACQALLANKLMTAQWWEEDRSEDNFYRATGRALSYYTRPDGKVTGIWKGASVTITDDAGESWISTGAAPGLFRNSSKYWAQRTDDGRYALVYNPTTRLRHPLVVTLSEDGETYSQLLTVHGELPPQRFRGNYKNMGPQYVRGIVEGNGNPPGDDLWLTYSVNKEDMWVASVPTPITADAPAPTPDEFEQTTPGELPTFWNIYRPLWAPVDIVDLGGEMGHVLSLSDEDPYDYAAVTRAFPTTRRVAITFKFLAKQTDARLEFDVVGPDGMRPVQVALTEDGKIEARHEGYWMPGGEYEANRWTELTIDVNPNRPSAQFRILVDGVPTLYRDAYFSDFISHVERFTIRTGEYRRRAAGGRIAPEDADNRDPKATFLIDDVSFLIRGDND